MPLFYFRPIDLHADKKQEPPLIAFDLDMGSTMVYLVVGAVGLFLFVMFVVFPMLQVIGQTP